MPKPGTKYYAGLDREGPKTGRRYGHVVAAIRAVKGIISTDAFEPKYSRRQISTVITDLVERGEFERVRKGKGGPYGSRPALYRRREHILRGSVSPSQSREADNLEPYNTAL